jgi:exopolysaccharide production protein ExoZ
LLLTLVEVQEVAPAETKLPGIQIARSIAALSIVYFHSWTALDRFPKETAYPLPWLSQYGWLGVDLFFAISGFVICMVVSKPGFAPGPFVAKRAFRLYPLWLATLTLFAILAWVWRGPLPTETVGYFFYSASLLPTENFPFYDIGWSLQHEMLFYFLASAIVPFFGRWGLLILLSISAAAYHAIAMPWFPGHFAMYHGEFLAGCLAFLVFPRWRFGPLIPLAIGCVSLWYFTFGWGGRALFPVPLFFLIVGAATLRLTSNGFTKAAVALGDASYSIYLVHPLVLVVVKAATLKIATAATTWLEEPIRLACFLIVVVLSLLSWHYFERPFIALGNRLVEPERRTAPA